MLHCCWNSPPIHQWTLLFGVHQAGITVYCLVLLRFCGTCVELPLLAYDPTCYSQFDAKKRAPAAESGNLSSNYWRMIVYKLVLLKFSAEIYEEWFPSRRVIPSFHGVGDILFENPNGGCGGKLVDECMKSTVIG